MKRWDLINAMLARSTRDKTIYLEIGTQNGDCLSRVKADVKWGVDPSNTAQRFAHAFFKQRSDEFFATRKMPAFDVVFVDGLHHHEQVLRDVDNALGNLSDDGVVILHDCNPQTEEAQIVPRPQGQSIWNGDCWRALVDLRLRSDIDVCVLDSDHGLGIVCARPTTLPLDIENTAELSYEDFAKDRKRLLNLIAADQLQTWLDKHPEPVATATNGEIVVLTAIFGDRDKLLDPKRRIPGHRYICVTDQPISSDAWEVVRVPAANNPRLAARRVKLLAHEYVDAEKVVWVDGSMHIFGDMRRLFSGPFDIAAFPHPERNCIYKEVQACSDLRRADAEILKRQARKYRKAGIPEEGGLFATGLLARRMSSEVKALGVRWFKELAKTTLRDQVSLPVVLHEQGLRCQVIREGSVYRSRYATYTGHRGADSPHLSALVSPGRPRPAVYTCIAYDESMNLGAAYNRFMETLPDDAWACFLDHDAMFTTSSWYPQILDIIEQNPSAGLLAAVTNRVNNTAQVVHAPKHNVVAHRKLGQQLQKDLRTFVEDLTDGPLISGVVMCLSKAVWAKTEGFRDGFLGVDNQMHLDVARAGKRVLLMRGVYVYHWYRAHGDTDHLDRLGPEHRWQPR